jgi:hypothetical protein
MSDPQRTVGNDNNAADDQSASQSRDANFLHHGCCRRERDTVGADAN